MLHRQGESIPQLVLYSNRYARKMNDQTMHVSQDVLRHASIHHHPPRPVRMGNLGTYESGFLCKTKCIFGPDGNQTAWKLTLLLDRSRRLRQQKESKGQTGPASSCTGNAREDGTLSPTQANGNQAHGLAYLAQSPFSRQQHWRQLELTPTRALYAQGRKRARLASGKVHKCITLAPQRMIVTTRAKQFWQTVCGHRGERLMLAVLRCVGFSTEQGNGKGLPTSRKHTTVVWTSIDNTTEIRWHPSPCNFPEHLVTHAMAGQSKSRPNPSSERQLSRRQQPPALVGVRGRQMPQTRARDSPALPRPLRMPRLLPPACGNLASACAS